MTIKMEVEVEKVSGPFASREAIGAELVEMLSVDDVTVDESVYEILEVQVIT
jgi:hypothetical protein